MMIMVMMMVGWYKAYGAGGGKLYRKMKRGERNHW